jgi:hypothetical protein
MGIKKAGQMTGLFVTSKKKSEEIWIEKNYQKKKK